jgi:choline dehydrogenase
VVINDDENHIGISASPQLALGKGELRLKSNDPLEFPFLDYNYYDEPFDLERMWKAIPTCVEIRERPSYREILLERVNPVDADLTSDGALDEWPMRNSGTSHHVSGTRKMGPASDGMAVVDQRGRSHGLENIRVAGASIMPDCIRANTNATTIMIGEKVADCIRTGR